VLLLTLLRLQMLLTRSFHLAAQLWYPCIDLRNDVLKNKNTYIVQKLGLQQQRGKGHASLGQGMRDDIRAWCGTPFLQVLFGPAFFKRHGLAAVQAAFLEFEGNFEVSSDWCIERHSHQYIKISEQWAPWRLAPYNINHASMCLLFCVPVLFLASAYLPKGTMLLHGPSVDTVDNRQHDTLQHTRCCSETSL
jgi:hypothetical protein